MDVPPGYSLPEPKAIPKSGAANLFHTIADRFRANRNITYPQLPDPSRVAQMPPPDGILDAQFATAVDQPVDVGQDLDLERAVLDQTALLHPGIDSVALSNARRQHVIAHTECSY